MFSSINLLFLLSLGFTTWIILCYFKQIEILLMHNSTETQDVPTMENEMENDNDSIPEKIVSPVPPTNMITPCHDTTEVYVNFLCIFVCIYVLIKITLMAEEYIAKYIGAKYHMHIGEENDNDTNVIGTETIQDLREQHGNLLMQMKTLEKQNMRLKHLLCVPENHEISSEKKDDKRKPDINTRGLQNIFISNRHFHLNRQVFVKERNVTVCFEDNCMKKASNTGQVWDKYLELQQSTATKNNSYNKGTEKPAFAPVVMSAEELKTKEGLF